MKQIDCRYCGDGKMVEQTYSRKIKSGRAVLSVDGLLNWHCNACKSEMVDSRQFELNADLIEEAEKKSAGFVSVGMLLEFREKYSLTQREASKLIGAGEGAFGKYEAGGKLSAPTAKLIRAALKVPGVVEMLAYEEGIALEAESGGDLFDSSASIQDALSEASSWTTDEVPVAFQWSLRTNRHQCVNDEIFMTDAIWNEVAWAKPMLARA